MKVLMLELQYEIEKKFVKREAQLNLSNVIDICTKVEIANENLGGMITEANRFWNEIKKDQLTEKELYEIMNNVLEKEEVVERTISDLKKHPSAHTQNMLYSYALKLFNFDYEPEFREANSY